MTVQKEDKEAVGEDSGAAHRSRRAVTYGWASAAGIVLLVGAAMLVKTGPSQAPIAITQRAYAGTNDSADAAAPGPREDRDVEIAFAATPSTEAALVPVDAVGRSIANVQWFMHAPDGRLTLVVAPRTFAPHPGEAHGLVLVGEAERVHQAVTEIGKAKEVSSYEGVVRARARAFGVRVEEITIGASD